MFKLKFKSLIGGYSFLVFLLCIVASLVVNFIQLCFLLANPILWSGDLAMVGKTAVKLIGLFPTAALITVWF